MKLGLNNYEIFQTFSDFKEKEETLSTSQLVQCAFNLIKYRMDHSSDEEFERSFNIVLTDIEIIYKLKEILDK